MFRPVPLDLPGGIGPSLPPMCQVQQHFDSLKLPDIKASVEAACPTDRVARCIKKGESVAIGVGSRGINNLSEVVRSVVRLVEACGGRPFIFPAMGSHGGATAQGQQALLARYGITEAKTGAPIRATMETILVDHMPDGTPLYMDKYAAEADRVVLINRVKPHTTVRGPIESGIIKMMVIGMGKIEGATIMHTQHGMDTFHDVLPRAAEILLKHIPLAFGVALVEDAFDQTSHIEALYPGTLFERERALLVMARQRMARLYFEEIDVLVIDEIGKEISGAGFDPNIAGRNSRGVRGFDHPRIKKLVLLDLTDETHGNATGVGLADVITRQLFDRIDFSSTYTNVITSAYLDAAAIPIIMDTAEDAVRIAMKTVLRVKPGEHRVVRIKNTLDLSTIWVSKPMLDEVQKHDKLSALGPPTALNWS